MPVSPEARAPDPLAALAHLLHALVGRPIAVQWQHAGEQLNDLAHAPSARMLVRTDSVLLPVSGDRTVLLASIVHAAAHLCHSPRKQAVGKLKPMGLAVASAIEDARVEWLMIQRYPGLKPLLVERAHRTCALPLGPEGGFSDLIARLHRALLDPLHHDDNFWVAKGQRLFHDCFDVLADAARFRQIASKLANDLGQMRVRMNLQGYAVPQPHGDDNSYLWDFAQTANSETPVVVPPPGGSTPRDPPEAQAPHSELVAPTLHTYPEWHHGLQRQRENWTTVIEHRLQQPAVPDEPAAPDPRRPRQTQRRRIDPGMRLRRQWEGDEIDLDAATEWMLARRMGLPLDPRVHRSAGTRPRPHSVLLLLDLSASANDRMGDAGRSILALSCEAALALVRTAYAQGDRVAVHGFSSNTRHQVDYLRLHEFGDTDADGLDQRLAHLQARHSTRLGAALRHALTCLRAETSPHRHILLLSDGECSDIDVFDPNYLREDARMAIHKAHQQGIGVTAVAINPRHAVDLQRMLGWGRFQAVMNPDALPRSLKHAYERIRVR